jgi:hypothetical protein
MGLTTAQLPDSSPYFCDAFGVATDLVSRRIQAASPRIYMLCVYNLGGSNLINFAQDPLGAPSVGSNTAGEPLTFFNYWRWKWNILGPVSGVVSSAGDQGSATSLEVPQSLKDLTLNDLQKLKDPYGRVYLQYAQAQGSLWGVS